MFITINARKARIFLTIVSLGLLGAVLLVSALSFRYPLKHLPLIRAVSSKYGIEPSVVCAVIHAESRFAEKALSPKGAAGLMQITMPTAQWAAGKIGMEFNDSDIFDPEINITIGCWYLSWLMERYENADVVSAAYNAGSGNVDKWLVNMEYSNDGETLRKIPFKETSDYVRRVRVNKKIYDIILLLGGKGGKG
ncbi:MAG: lytic transglycosylase domain-containing protein [Clostridiales bacterium]|jgi:soluble lytic murein transglycosylase|nr:lytic transglycosylase domain-containing protein [Clostridiales bacterium]